MAKVSIPRNEAERLYAFCIEHRLSHFGFAIEDGAFFHAFVGRRGNPDFKNVVVYLDGGDPKAHPDWMSIAAVRALEDVRHIRIPVDMLARFINDKNFASKRFFRVYLGKSKTTLLV